MTPEIAKLLETRDQWAQQALEQYEPLVTHIITTQNKDVNHICYTMDFMLDFCYNEKMLLLYRHLCKYLMDIDPQTTASYIQAYCDMWDEEGVKFGNNQEKKEEKA